MTRHDPLADPAPLIRRVYSFVAFHVRSPADAEDITSDVFERAVRYRESFDPDRAAPITWLLGIARRSIADARLNGHLSGDHAEDVLDPGDLEEDTIRRLELSSALDLLQERERELLALRYGSDLTTKDIAPLVGLAPGAVDVALHRARERLRAILGAPPEETVRRGNRARPTDVPLFEQNEGGESRRS